MGLNKSLEPIREYIPLIWILYIIWGIYLRLKYRFRTSSNELRIFTNNDDYNRILPFIFGILITIGSIFALKYMELDKIFWSLFTATGILLLILGFIFIPSGIIDVNNNILTFKIGAQKQKIGIRGLNSIELKSSEIILTEKEGKKHFINHVNFKESDYLQISEFLNEKLNAEIKVKTYGNI